MVEDKDTKKAKKSRILDYNKLKLIRIAKLQSIYTIRYVVGIDVIS